MNVVTYNEYLKNILVQVLNSYRILKEIEDKPGDLDHILRELSKINGFLKVVSHKIDSSKIPVSDFKKLQTKFEHYLENYSFEQEIETIGPLYSDDAYRIKNIRLKILEALEDKKMMDDIEELIEKILLVRKNSYYADAKIIDYWDVQGTSQKNVDVMTRTYS